MQVPGMENHVYIPMPWRWAIRENPFTLSFGKYTWVILSVIAIRACGILLTGLCESRPGTSASYKIREDLKHTLQELKRHPKESYNDVIERLVSLSIDSEPLNDDSIRGLEEAISDIRHRRLHSEEEIMAEFGVQ